MDDATRSLISRQLDNLAYRQEWNENAWWECHDLVKANWDDKLLAYVYDDIVHYSGVFHSRNIFGFRVKPDHCEFEQYRQEFRDIAAALRARMSLEDATKVYDL